jgi:hypothetical protein
MTIRIAAVIVGVLLVPVGLALARPTARDARPHPGAVSALPSFVHPAPR